MTSSGTTYPTLVSSGLLWLCSLLASGSPPTLCPYIGVADLITALTAHLGRVVRVGHGPGHLQRGPAAPPDRSGLRRPGRCGPGRRGRAAGRLSGRRHPAGHRRSRYCTPSWAAAAVVVMSRTAADRLRESYLFDTQRSRSSRTVRTAAGAHHHRGQADPCGAAPVSMRICRASDTLSSRTACAMAALAASGSKSGGITSSEKRSRSPRVTRMVSSPTG